MPCNAIKSIMSKYGHYDLAQIEYQRFKADSNRVNKANSTVEYLHILEKKIIQYISKKCLCKQVFFYFRIKIFHKYFIII